jgi:hypothetical protein
MEITVDYELIDGSHFFTSRHPLALGLCAASNNLPAAFADVSAQLVELLRDNHGISGACNPLVLVSECMTGRSYPWVCATIDSGALGG